jgi:hypothetical protein
MCVKNRYINKKGVDMKSLIQKLIQVEGELKEFTKSKEGYGYKYTPLDEILSFLRPLLAKHGLLLSQQVTIIPFRDDNWVRVKTIIRDETHSVSYTTTMPYKDLPKMQSVQSAGAHFTYARRYAISAIFNISSDEDTDCAVKSDINTTKPKPKVDKPTDKQLKRLYALVKKHNLAEQIKYILSADYGVKSSKELTIEQYNKLCKDIEKGVYDESNK